MATPIAKPTDFTSLFKHLLTNGITKFDCNTWEERDDKTKEPTGRVAMFIPWHLASKVSIADLTPLIPNGFRVKTNRREEDITTARIKQVEYTPSIVVENATDAEDFLNSKCKK